MRWISAPLLAIEGLTMRFGGLVAVNGLDFTVGRGDITALIGPNGAGKTTVFNCITGFYRSCGGRMALARTGCAAAEDVRALTQTGGRSASMASGEIFLLERMADFEIAKYAGVARTFQNIRLFAGMTALENLVVAQHNPLMRASVFSFAGLVSAPSFRATIHAARLSFPRGVNGTMYTYSSVASPGSFMMMWRRNGTAPPVARFTTGICHWSSRW